MGLFSLQHVVKRWELLETTCFLHHCLSSVVQIVRCYSCFQQCFCDATVTHDVLRWQVYAYSVEFGRQLGKWQPHDDAVSGLQLMHEDRLATASWDCAIKLWQ